MNNKRFLILGGNVFLALALIAVLFSATIARAEKPIQLNYAFYGTSIGAVAKTINWWTNEVNKRTFGAVEIKVHWGGTLARVMEMVEAVRTGTADIGDSVWTPYFPERFRLMGIGDFPVPFLDKPLAMWLATEQLTKEFPEFEKELEAVNMKRLTYYGNANIQLISRRPVRKLSDLKGLKVRCSGKLHPRLLKAVGAVPIFIPSSEAFDGLQKGVIDATTCTALWALDYKYHETAAKYFTNVGLGGDPGEGAMMNLDVWNKLPKDVQDVFMRLREEYPRVHEERLYRETRERGYKTLRDAGVEIIDFSKADREIWKSKPVCEKQGKEWVEVVAKARGMSKARVRKILDRYIELNEAFGKIYPREF